MQTFNFISINIFAFIMLIYILGHTLRNDRLAFIRHWLFVGMVISIMFILIVDAGAWAVNTLPGESAHTLNILFNTLLFIFTPVPAVLWYMYADFQIFHSYRRTRVAAFIFAPPVLVNAIFSAISPYTGWYFTVDSANVFHRGPMAFYIIFMLLSIGLFVVVFIKILIHRRQIERRYLPALMLFALPPFVAAAIQFIFYGTNIFWSFAALSMLHIFISIQNHRLSTDYLTGAFNRRHLHSFLRDKIWHGSVDVPFAGMMLDIDGFKKINDTFGHKEGDHALEDTVKILRQCLRERDLVFRYGGDEFLIILDIHAQQDLEAAVGRIHAAFKRFNDASHKPYTLTPSIGYMVYERGSGMKPDEFIDLLDKRMYQEKNMNKE